jgi:hypothetical protein
MDVRDKTLLLEQLESSDGLWRTEQDQMPDLVAEPDLLRRFEADAERAGLVGEKRNACVVFLTAVSAKLQKPLNVSVGGASAAGKNHLTGAVAAFIPEERKKILTGMTPKVLMYSEQDEFKHKAVFINEYEGVAGADYPIRTMQSERFIEWEFVDKTDKGMQKRKKRVNGPAAFIQATTRVTLHPENETRLLFIQMDESVEQTRAINRRQAMEAERKIPPSPEDLYTQWHEFLRSLEQLPVRIPFAGQLADEFPGRVQSRRDLPKLLGLIEVTAYLHQHRRGRDDNSNIVATPDDYYAAKRLFEHCYYAGPESKVGELILAAGRLSSEFSAAELIQPTGWKKSKVYEVLARAEEIGCIVEIQRGLYHLVSKDVVNPLHLPTKIKLAVGDFRFSAKGGG